MKIITGLYGGRRFDPPRQLDARPTTDLAKQALFNILQNRIDLEGCRALDLFSGTGSITFELISRGAAHVVSVEKGRTQQQFIRKVAAELKVPPLRHQLICGDVFRYLSSLPASSPRSGQSSARPFDIIFADPPYDLDRLAELPDLILGPAVPSGPLPDSEGVGRAPALLAPGGLLILEHGKASDFSSHPLFQELRTYGAVHFSFFQLPSLQ